MKYSKNFNSDWDFYMQNDWLDFLRINPTKPTNSPNGASAKECFYIYDSTGLLYACCEPELFNTILNRKANINMQIEMWVAGFKDCLMPVSEYMETFKGNVPKWIEKAFRNSLKSKYNSKDYPYFLLDAVMDD